MGILNQTSESFSLSVRDVAERVDADVCVDFECSSFETFAQKNHLQEILSKRLTEAIWNINTPNPSSIQIRKAIQDVLGCKVSVRRKQWFFGKGSKLSYFYDIEFAAYMHRGFGHRSPKRIIPEVIINSCAVGIDCEVELKSISTIHIVLKQISPSDHYKF